MFSASFWIDVYYKAGKKASLPGCSKNSSGSDDNVDVDSIDASSAAADDVNACLRMLSHISCFYFQEYLKGVAWSNLKKQISKYEKYNFLVNMSTCKYARI